MTTQSGSKNIRPIKENLAGYRSLFMNAAAGRNKCSKLATLAAEAVNDVQVIFLTTKIVRHTGRRILYRNLL